MATDLSRFELRNYSQPLSGSISLPAATRLAFYIAYYALNVSFAAELFSVMLTLPVFLICCFNISRIKGNYATAQDMIWLVIYMFFAIAPCQALRSGYFYGGSPVGGLYFEESEIIDADLVVVVFLFTASITTTIVAKYYPAEPEEVSYELSHRNLLLTASLSAFSFFMFVFFMNGLGNVLADRYSKVDPEVPFLIIFPALQSIACLFACICMKRKPLPPVGSWLVNLSLCLLTLFFLVVAQNPFNTARFTLLMTYFPVVLVLCSGKIRVSIFYLVAMIGLLVIMPILSSTGRFGVSISEALGQIDASEYFFKVPYLDVFDMLVYEVRYLQSTGLFWGGKTLGALFFFVPRAIWAGKETLIAQDMGAQLMDLKTSGTDNLSLWFAGEFYADLGLVGVGVGAFVVALLLTIFGVKRTVKINGLDLRSFIVTAAAPIIIRGPIGAVMPLLLMQMVFLTVLTRLLCNRSGLDAR
jgi:hypothetical protein